MKSGEIRLQDRDMAILRHVEKHRMSWHEPLYRLFFTGKGEDALKSTLRRLCGSAPKYRFLRPEPLDGRRVYYRLTGKATTLLGSSPKLARRLGRIALLRSYALQWWIYLQSPGTRWLCNPREFAEQFELRGHRLPQGNFFIQQVAQETGLGFAIIDFGTDPRRLVRRTGDVIERFVSRGWFNDIIAAGLFSLCLLTVSDGKQRALRRKVDTTLDGRCGNLLADYDTDVAQLVQVHVVPHLVDILPGTPRNPRH